VESGPAKSLEGELNQHLGSALYLIDGDDARRGPNREPLGNSVNRDFFRQRERGPYEILDNGGLNLPIQ
jgi:hypothetical protein